MAAPIPFDRAIVVEWTPGHSPDCVPSGKLARRVDRSGVAVGAESVTSVIDEPDTSVTPAEGQKGERC